MVRASVRATQRLPLEPQAPLDLRRRLLDVVGRTVPSPPGTRRSATSLAGVPVALIEHESAERSRAILYLHGGCYVVGSRHTHGAFAAHLSLAAGAPVHLLEYRLAPENPYPAALDDAVAAYRALLDAGHAPERIAIAGDSAGGGLTLAAAMRLRDQGLPLPAVLALISPWVDLALSGASIEANARFDAGLSPAALRYGAARYRRSQDARLAEISPLYGDLGGLPPIHVQAVAEEILLSDAERLAERAAAAGVEVDLRRYSGLWHDFQLGPGVLREADAAVEDLASALRAAWGAAAEAARAPDEARRRVFPPTPEIAIVGGGFGGVGMGVMLTRAGIDSFTILERGDNVGGVWRDNTYPGAACDVPSHLYSFSFEPHHGWSRRYSPQPEILAYLEECASKYGFSDRLRLNTEATRAEFDERAGRWRIATSDGESIEADVLVTACGQLSRPANPEIPGIERFEGRSFHSARWDHECELTGKRVAVLGTGASAIQFVPAIAPQVEHMQIFQRSAPHVVPKPDRAYRSWEGRLFRALPALQALSRLRIWLFFEGLIPFFTRASRGMGAMERLYFQRQFERQVTDPALRAALRPDHVMGCKRILISSDWYPTLMRPNVELVTDRVIEVTPTGLVTEDGAEREFDVIIFGTGFHSTEFLAPMEVRGLGGRDLNDAWGAGAEAYLGLAVAGFPNLFMLYGPNTNLGAGSIIFQLESQIEYAIDAVRTVGRNGAAYLDVRADAQEEFNRELQGRLEDSVWNAGCTNWYVTEAGRNTNNWPGSTLEYRRRTRRLDPGDYHLVERA